MRGQGEGVATAPRKTYEMLLDDLDSTREHIRQMENHIVQQTGRAFALGVEDLLRTHPKIEGIAISMSRSEYNDETYEPAAYVQWIQVGGVGCEPYECEDKEIDKAISDFMRQWRQDDLVYALDEHGNASVLKITREGIETLGYVSDYSSIFK